MSKNKAKIAIVGGGVAGSTAALYFGELGLDVTLFEKESSLICGPPFCHLHAGGNLYREISDAQCLALLRQSIGFLRYYPYCVDYRPTVIALPATDKTSPQELMPRLKLLQNAYAELIKKDAANEVLGKPDTYFKLYSKEKLESLRSQNLPTNPSTNDEWMISVAKHIDFEQVQFPLILVQEYGLNLFRLSAGLSLSLENNTHVTLHTSSIVHNIQRSCKSGKWQLSYVKDEQSHLAEFDYLINAAGFRTGKIDDLIGAPCERLVEFKAAYVSYWETKSDVVFPEIVFHGERGTPQGMGQFTPYPHGYFQLHGMTKEITLYEDGLVANSLVSCQPRLGEDFMEKIELSWQEEETHRRTHAAIDHLARFIPSFKAAAVGSKPLFGAQQIPGDDPTLRVAEVSFPMEQYARCEIVKVSSVLDMCEAIAKEFAALGYLDSTGTPCNTPKESLDEVWLSQRAKETALARDYPASLAERTTPKAAI